MDVLSTIAATSPAVAKSPARRVDLQFPALGVDDWDDSNLKAPPALPRLDTGHAATGGAVPAAAAVYERNAARFLATVVSRFARDSSEFREFKDVRDPRPGRGRAVAARRSPPPPRPHTRRRARSTSRTGPSTCSRRA